MTAIRSSLQRLTAALGKLESSVDSMEGAMAGKQRDMFAMPSSNQNAAGTIVGQDKEKIAARLDVAIEKVERLLTSDARG